MQQSRNAELYSQLLFEFDKVSNQINSIKGESIDLNEEQNRRIQNLQIKQGRIMSEMQKLMSR